MANLEAFLKSNLAKAKRIAVLGIGSDLRGDDAAGTIAAEALAKLVKKGSAAAKRVKIFLGSTAPENLTGEVKKYKPTHVIIIDTVEMKEKAGTILVLNPREVGGGVSFSTHVMPARILADYLQASLECDVTLIGIQPASLKFGTPASKSVKSSALHIASAIRKAI